MRHPLIQSHLKTIWEESPIPSRPSLPGDIAVDVVIVGAGITGLTAALLLSRQGRKVAVVEAFHIGAGTTGATTAHLTTDCDSEYSSLIKSYGHDQAGLVRQSLAEAIALIERIVQEEGIDCDFRRVPGYLYTERGRDESWLQSEYDALTSVGMSVEMIDAAPLPFPTRRAIRFDRQAAFHPNAYLRGLAEAVENAGGRIFEKTNVRDFKDGSPCRVVTERGVITAADVILATHTPLGRNPLHAVLAPVRSFVLAIKTAREVPDALFWDTEDPYNYIRRHRSADPHTLIIGGRDQKTAHHPEAESFTALEAYARRRFDDAAILSRWSAQFYDPADRVPFVGKNLLSHHVYIATGFSGDGLTFGTIAASMLATQIEGGETPYDGLFHPARIRAAGLKDFVKDQIDVAACFLGDRLPGALPKTLDVVGAGTGAIVNIDGKKVAAYRDDGGALRTFSAVCPHLGCLVRWNDENATFDCPCHGSRFDTHGKRLEGPSLQSLAPITPGTLAAKRRQNAKAHDEAAP